MMFLSGMLLGTFLGFLIAGMCSIARTNRIEHSSSVTIAEIDEVA